MLLLSMIECPVIVIKGLFSQGEYVVHLLEVEIRVPVGQELEPSSGKAIDEVFPVKLCKVEAKYLLVLRSYFLVKSLASIAIKNPFSSPEESKCREKGVYLFIDKF